MGVTAREPSPSAMSPRVLVVVDEPPLVRAVRIGLGSAGFVVEAARTSLDALELLTRHPPDVLVLDLVLPDGGGVEVCREVRRLSRLPIVVMSAAGEERETVRALDAGADECLTKPFGVSELLAGLRRVLPGRVAGSESWRLEIGELVIDLERRRVSLAGAVVLLAPVEFELVRVLAQRQGRLVTDRQLSRALWGPAHRLQTGDLRMHVARVRVKLERDQLRPEYLMAEPGVGYRLCQPHEVLS